MLYYNISVQICSVYSCALNSYEHMCTWLHTFYLLHAYALKGGMQGGRGAGIVVHYTSTISIKIIAVEAHAYNSKKSAQIIAIEGNSSFSDRNKIYLLFFVISS